MKDIITGTSMTETKSEATRLWKEYVAAAKTFKDPIYDDLQKIYNQVKGGRKVIDIGKVIAKGGVHQNFHPKLAIAKATNKQVTCHYYQDGTVKYLNGTPGWNLKELSCDIILKNCLPNFKMQSQWDKLALKAPVPLIPAKLRPNKLTDDYYILWEVDVWQMIPPTDPYLLRRITKNMFVVVAGWDLTEIEKSAMAGRMY